MEQKEFNCGNWLSPIFANRTRKLLDSWGRVSSGGELFDIKVWPGVYDECREAGGRHCWLRGKNSWTHETGNTLFVGVCVPEICNDSSAATSLISARGLIGKFSDLHKTFSEFRVHNIECERNSDMSVSTVIAWSILSLYILIVLSATLIHVSELIREEYFRAPVAKLRRTGVYGAVESTPKMDITSNKDDITDMLSLLKNFSVLINIKSLFSERTSQSTDDLGCLHGLRVISMIGVIIGHHYLFIISTPDFRQFLLLMPDHILWDVLLKMLFFTVDSFFVLSGFLLVYVFQQKNEHKLSNWFKFFVYRYVRLAPAMLVVILVFLYVLPILSKGPFWFYTRNSFRQKCLQTWWWYLLFINNFLGGKTCMVWLWYLACDMQFYVISPIFLLILQRSTLWGTTSVVVSLLSSVAVTSSFSYAYNVSPFFIFPHKLQLDVDPTYDNRFKGIMDTIYVTPYSRIGSYFIGMLLGILMKYDWIPNRCTLISGWLLSGVSLFVMGFALAYDDIGKVINALVNGVFHVIWSTIIAWIIYNCAKGRTLWLNNILSNSIWRIPSRLTYCTYLVHYMVVGSSFANLKNTLPISLDLYIIMVIGNTVVSYLCALILTVTVESPFLNMLKSISGKI